MEPSYDSDMARDVNEVRRDILVMHKRLEDENYYQLLGVDTSADAALVGARFRELARTWHVDRFSQYDLGPDKPKVQEIFSKLNAAHRTLSNPEKRAEYDLEIDEGPDIGAILEAESHFRAGKNRLQSGSYRGAHEAFKQAVELNADELEYEAYVLFTEYMLVEKDEDGIATNRKRAKEIFDNLDAINVQMSDKHWLLTFLGTVSMGLGDDRTAESLFQEALLANSQDTDAKRMLRLLRSRRKRRGEKKGFFAKLFGK